MMVAWCLPLTRVTSQRNNHWTSSLAANDGEALTSHCDTDAHEQTVRAHVHRCMQPNCASAVGDAASQVLAFR